MVNELVKDYRVSQRKACKVIMVHRSTYQYIPAEKNEAFLRSRIREIAEVRIRYGFWRVFILLRREGWKDNHKRVYRIYKEEGLNLRTKRPRRRKAAAHRVERPEISTIPQCWIIGPMQIM